MSNMIFAEGEDLVNPSDLTSHPHVVPLTTSVRNAIPAMWNNIRSRVNSGTSGDNFITKAAGEGEVTQNNNGE